MKKYTLMLILLILPLLAYAFPFRSVEPGKTMPSVQLKKTDGTNFSLSPDAIKGKGLILLFWGADSEAKKRRTIELMEILNDVAKSNQEIKVAAINAQDCKAEVVDQIVGMVKPVYPFLLDQERNAYNAFGVFVMPSILIVNGQGGILTGFGYSNNIRDKIETQVSVLLGKMSEQEAVENHKLHVATKTTNEEKALQHLTTGLRMDNMGMPDKAKKEYIKAVELFKSAEAYIRLGLIYLEEGDIKEAEKDINEGLSIDADLLIGKIAYAKLCIEKGKFEEVIQELNGLTFRAPGNYSVRYTLGLAYEKKGDYKNAVKQYKKAFKLLQKEALRR